MNTVDFKTQYNEAVNTFFKNNVINAFPSVFTKEDIGILFAKFNKEVEVLVDGIEADVKPSNIDLDALKQRIIDNVENTLEGWNVDTGDLSDLKFSIDYNNCIELDSCSLDSTDIVRDVKNNLRDEWNEMLQDCTTTVDAD